MPQSGLPTEELPPLLRHLVAWLDALALPGSIATREDPDVRWLNKAARQQFGFGEWERWSTRVLAEDRTKAVLHAHEPEWASREYRLVCGDGQIAWIHETGALLHDQRGQPVGWVGLLLDRRDQTRLQARLQRALALQRWLLAWVAAKRDGSQSGLEGALAGLCHVVNGTGAAFLWWDAGETEPCCWTWGTIAAARDALFQLAAQSTLAETLAGLSEPLSYPTAAIVPTALSLALEKLQRASGAAGLILAPVREATLGTGVLIIATRTRGVSNGESESLVAIGAQGLGMVLGRERLQQREAEQHAWLRSLIAGVPDAILVLDDHGMIRFASAATEAVIGQPPSALIGAPIVALAGDDDHSSLTRWLVHVLRHPGLHCSLTFTARRAGGEARQLEVFGLNCLHDPQVRGVIATLRDVTERWRLETQLRRLAYEDAVTGLASHAGFLAACEHLAARAHEAGHPFGVLVLDIERFSLINHVLGHDVGDRALAAIGARLHEALDVEACVGRLGGDVFAVGFTGAGNTVMLERWAQSLITSLQGWYEVAGKLLFVSFRAGLAIAEAGQSPAEVVRDAEIALAEVKRQPGLIMTRFTPSMREETATRQRIEQDLRLALETDQLQLVFQPVIDVHTRRPVTLEALLRWPHPELGPIPPPQFITVAEATGLIRQLTAWVIERACRQAVDWATLHPLLRDVGVSVNLSPFDLLNPTLPRLVASTLARTGLPPERLTLEITESAMLDADKAADQVQRLRALGVAVVVDDFGAGHSSLRYVKELPVSGLKIDRQLVVGLGRDPSSATLLRAILQMGEALGLGMTAEGVETPEQFSWLQDANCGRIQGYLIAPPLAIEALRQFLERWERETS